MSELFAEAVLPRKHLIGESPKWDPETGRIIWVDIQDGTVFTGILEDDSVTVTSEIKVDDYVGVAVPATNGTLTVAGHTAIWRLWENGNFHPIAQLITSDRRWNDGAVDPVGQLLIGSVSLYGEPTQNMLLRLQHNGSVSYLDEDITQANGMGWSPDGEIFYLIDSARNTVYHRKYDPSPEFGEIREVAFTINDHGTPDGMAVDADGNLWIAIWGRGQVRCYTPDGQLLHTIQVPAPNVTCPVFAGPDLDTMLITTASQGLDQKTMETYPESGYIFGVSVKSLGVKGLPQIQHKVNKVR